MVRVPVQDIGRFLRDIRLGQPWTQEQLSVASGVSVPTIARLERGEMTVKLITFAKIAIALGLGQDMHIELKPLGGR